MFDSSWANASHAMGQRYYPKLQSCVPFSPVTGPRLLVAPGPHKGALMRGLASALLQMTGACVTHAGISGVLAGQNGLCARERSKRMLRSGCSLRVVCVRACVCARLMLPSPAACGASDR